MTRLLRYSLGPVGGFIGEARRTRDYWAGSFLLSWLTSVAIVQANRAGAKVLSPVVLDPFEVDKGELADVPPLLRAVAKAPAFRAEYEAQLPNQFRALVPDDFDPNGLRTAILARWRALAGAVWQDFIEPALSSDREQLERSWAIWSDQIGPDGSEAAFWETIWVMGPSEHHEDRPDDTWLIERKRNRKPFYLGDNGKGDLCSITRDLREISGWQRSSNRLEQDGAWHLIIEHLSQIDGGRDEDARTLDLRQGERLSAPSLVKRLFPKLRPDRLAQPEVFGWLPPSLDRWTERRRAASRRNEPISPNIRYWPSTAAIAASPWLAHVITSVDPATLQLLVQAARSLSYKDAVAERQSRIWEEQVFGTGNDILRGADAIAGFLALDGTLFFAKDVRIADTNVTGGLDRSQGSVDAVPRVTKDPSQVLQEHLRKVTEQAGNLSPSPYVALLHMDGDGMGALVAKHGDRAIALLNGFEDQVFKFIDESTTLFGGRRPGDILYAAGDELLMICPASDVLDVSLALSRVFDELAQSHLPDEVATLSAAVSMADFRYPLSRLVRSSKELLRKTKDVCGGGGLGVEILALSGKNHQWIGVADPDGGKPEGLTPTLSLYQWLAKFDASMSGFSPFSNRVRYRISKNLAMVDPMGRLQNWGDKERLAEILSASFYQSCDGPLIPKIADLGSVLCKVAIPISGLAKAENIDTILRVAAIMRSSIDDARHSAEG